MRVMILGAGGMLGHDLVETAPAGTVVLPFDRLALDITDTASLTRAVADARPDVIINAAAYTAVDKAEVERDLAFRVNAEAVGELGRIAQSTQTRVLHYSTDYVFDGASSQPYVEDAHTNPINVYGRSKLAGERSLQESGASYLLIRTSWLFGVHGRSFPKTMWDRARRGLATKVVNDQVGRPTYTKDLARASWILVDRGMSGVYHVANREVATWFDVASQIFAYFGQASRLMPCATDEYPAAAKRPPYSALDTCRGDQYVGHLLRIWRAALSEFLTECEGWTGTS